MKILNIIPILGLTLFAFSCTEDREVFYDFSGTYIGEVSCEGAEIADNGEEAVFEIIRIDAIQFYVNVGDDVEFLAKNKEGILVIDRQTYNEGNGFDEVTLEGKITPTNTGINTEFEVSVDDEGTSFCDMTLEKQ